MSARTSDPLLSIERARWARFVILIASTVAGISYGVLDDMAAGGVSVHQDILAALLFSPLANAEP